MCLHKIEGQVRGPVILSAHRLGLSARGVVVAWREGSAEEATMESEARSAGPVIYIDRSDVRENCLDELKAGVRELVAFVDAHQQQMAKYSVYFEEDRHRMTVVSVHPDSASLERLGARRVDIGQGEVTWTVMADPEGNESCVVRALRPDEGALPYGD